MSTARILNVIVAGAAALAACTAAPDTGQVEAKLKAATAEATGGASGQVISITGQQRTAARWTWRATVDGKSFNCDADNLYRLPACAPVDQTGA